MTDIANFADALHQLGTRHIFGIPGEGASLDLLTEFERRGGRFHAVGHEAAAALMAGGYGRVAGIPGVSLSIKGPGFANMLAGIATNWLDRNPALSLSESYGPGSHPARMHKRLSHAALAAPVVKAYADNPSPALLQALWDRCLAEEPGPVHVDISGRMAGDTIAGPSGPPLSSGLDRRAVDLIRGAQRPVVIAGGLASRRAWRHKLAGLNVPVFTTAAGKGAIDEALPSAAGVLTLTGGRHTPERTILPWADLIVGLGLRTTELLDVRPFAAPLVRLDEMARAGAGLAPALELLCTDSAFLEALAVLGEKNWGAEELRAARGTLHKALQPDRWLPAQVFTILQSRLPPSSRIVLDTGHFCTIGEHALVAHGPGQVVGSLHGRSMGAALPFGVGAAVSGRTTPTAIVVGDGGVRMYPEAFTVAVREHLPVLLVLMADGSYGSIRRAAADRALAQEPLQVESGYWDAVFHALGAATARVESAAALDRALDLWSSSPAPLFLQLRFGREPYLRMTEGIR